jgi:hypothetical protein
MTIVVGLLLAVLGILVGSATAFVFAHYMRWVRRHHPVPAVVRGWRLPFVFPALMVLFATIQTAGVSGTAAVDIHHRELVLFGYPAGFVGTPSRTGYDAAPDSDLVSGRSTRTRCDPAVSGAPDQRRSSAFEHCRGSRGERVSRIRWRSTPVTVATLPNLALLDVKGAPCERAWRAAARCGRYLRPSSSLAPPAPEREARQTVPARRDRASARLEPTTRTQDGTAMNTSQHADERRAGTASRRAHIRQAGLPRGG